ncbi:MAG: hypothetical protein HY047_11595 [Acidobacteria bacterium]|nr:hypothetical protein [Acidobacteriota bacterium]
MRSRMIVGVFLLIALVGAGSLAARGDNYVGSDKQWTIVNFPDPVVVKGEFIMGPVLIVHDSAKMARGEACTTFYRFDRAAGPKEELVSFHCTPRPAESVDTTKFTTASTDPGCKKLVEFQFAGDSEAHGVPIE